jgi:hypothetical protein
MQSGIVFMDVTENCPTGHRDNVAALSFSTNVSAGDKAVIILSTTQIREGEGDFR